MIIDSEAVIRLSQLTLTDAEKSVLVPQLDNILDHIGTLNTLMQQTEIPVMPGEMPLRPDDPTTAPPINGSEMAPRWEEGGFYVPKIMG